MKITARKNIPFFNRKELLQIMKKRPAIQHTLLFLLLLFLLCVTSACKVHARITTLITGTQKNVTQAETVTGTWEKTESGVTFKPQDGKIITNQWINFKGKIYYLDSKGQRVTEWVLYRGKRYYLTKYGEATVSPDGKKSKEVTTILIRTEFYRKTAGSAHQAIPTVWIRMENV